MKAFSSDFFCASERKTIHQRSRSEETYHLVSLARF